MVAVCDVALGVGGGHQHLLGWVIKVLLGDWQIYAHGNSLLKNPSNRAITV
jgi:hypothetical protein